MNMKNETRDQPRQVSLLGGFDAFWSDRTQLESSGGNDQPISVGEPGLIGCLLSPVAAWHDSKHELVEQRDGEGRIAVARTPYHPLRYQLAASRCN
jgi:hypothetical protein